MNDLTLRISKLAAWINEHILGNPWSLVVCILFVVVVFSLIVVQGYSHWNLSTGLFANDAESAYELITGTASVVAVIALHKAHRDHRAEMRILHNKVDSLVEANQTKEVKQ